MMTGFLKEMNELLTDAELRANALVIKRAKIKGEMDRLSQLINTGHELIKSHDHTLRQVNDD